MKKYSYIAIVLFAVTLSFLTGYWSNYKQSATKQEPVYEGSESAALEEDFSSPSSGAIEISREKQQMIGVRVEGVVKKPVSHTIRLLGSVVPDENRLFRLNASTELWIRKVYPPTTGSFVKKNERLVAYYATNFLSAASSYMYALNTLDRQKAANMDSVAQLAVTNEQIRQAVESLQNLGVSDGQIIEMAKTRTISDFVDVRSPSDGFVLTRKASTGQWIGPGTELYQIADLSHVWILADIFENEAQYFRPGVKVLVTLPYQKKAYHATVSNVLPLFDTASRTLKVRLEAVNPGNILRPGMFVDLELPVKMPPAIAVPSEAIIFSGLKKTVFIDLGNGYFEPREVQTGWRLGNNIEITKGLKPGERIVISGNFLIDSESKLRGAGLGSAQSGLPEAGADSNR